jgi:sporulation protein YlmC with PRC-barrel domain
LPEADVDVVRDVLDKHVIDRDGREMGRVDGIVMEQDAGQPPRLTAILIGPSVLGDLLHRRCGNAVRAIERRFHVDRDRPTRIELADVDAIDQDVRVRIRIRNTAAAVVEERLRTWLLKLPGSR